MIFSLLLVLVAVAVLAWMGSIPLVPALLALAAVFVTLAAAVISRLRQVTFLSRQTKQRKAKWGGSMTLIQGLPTLHDQKYSFYLTRRDELLFESRLLTLSIPISEISHFLIIFGDALLSLSDQDLMQRMKLEQPPVLNLVRVWLGRHPDAQHRQLLLLWPTARAASTLNLGDLVVLADDAALGDLQSLLGRPEVAVKATVIGPRRSLEKRTKRPPLTELEKLDLPSRLEVQTEPFLLPNYDKEKEENNEH